MGLGIAIKVDGQEDAELAAASQVEVYERMGALTTFRIRYPVDIGGGDLPRLVDDRLEPGKVFTILEPTTAGVACLAKGPLRGHSVHLEHGGEGSWLEVTGCDTSIVMDRQARATVWSDVTDSDAASSVLSNYGYSLDVAATPAGHFENKHTLVQRDTDLRFVRRLARRNGCLFWVTCDADGIETAHFKRPPLDGDRQADLLVNLENSNAPVVDITWDVERPTSVVGEQIDLSNKERVDGSIGATPQTILGERSLAAITGDTRSAHLHAPVDDAGDLQARGEGLLIEADWFVQATCQTSLYALGKLVHPFTLIELNGVGRRYSGKYFVAAVRHRIDGVAHRMEISLLRNALGA